MSTHAHPSSHHHEGLLEDHSANDMPAARAIFLGVIVLLAVFSIVASVILFVADQRAPEQPPVEQPEILDGRTG
ncbi:MAG TPA: hypothetical protein PLB89_02980 [Flavobacteriales bacterium]|nr:hypothetical protein [Flavobacteriales bacterium]